MHTIKLCSVLFGVVVHAAVYVINKIHWCMAICAVNEHTKCYLDAVLSITLQQLSIQQPHIGREFATLPTHLHLTPPLGGFISEYCHYVWYAETVMIWLLTHSLTAALDQLRVVASSTSNDPGP